MSENTNTTLDSILDSTLDDLADLPEFSVFAPGVHRVVIDFEQKTVSNHPSIEAKFKLLETVELANPAEDTAAAIPGTESSVLFTLDNKFGQGKFKEFIKPICEHLGVSSIRAAVDGAKGLEVLIVTKIRQNKEKTQHYLDVVSLNVL